MPGGSGRQIKKRTDRMSMFGFRSNKIGGDPTVNTIVESENEMMEFMVKDLCQWLAQVVGQNLELTPDNFFSLLSDGVILCRLANAIQDYAIRMAKERENCPLGNKICYKSSNVCERDKSKFHARENVCKFLEWCKSHNVPIPMLFESNDIVMGETDGGREVIICLMNVAKRFGIDYHVPAPETVKLDVERELNIKKGTAAKPIVVERTQSTKAAVSAAILQCQKSGRKSRSHPSDSSSTSDDGFTIMQDSYHFGNINKQDDRVTIAQDSYHFGNINKQDDRVTIAQDSYHFGNINKQDDRAIIAQDSYHFGNIHEQADRVTIAQDSYNFGNTHELADRVTLAPDSYDFGNTHEQADRVTIAPDSYDFGNTHEQADRVTIAPDSYDFGNTHEQGDRVTIAQDSYHFGNIHEQDDRAIIAQDSYHFGNIHEQDDRATIVPDLYDFGNIHEKAEIVQDSYVFGNIHGQAADSGASTKMFSKGDLVDETYTVVSETRDTQLAEEELNTENKKSSVTFSQNLQTMSTSTTNSCYNEENQTSDIVTKILRTTSCSTPYYNEGNQTSDIVTRNRRTTSTTSTSYDQMLGKNVRTPSTTSTSYDTANQNEHNQTLSNNIQTTPSYSFIGTIHNNDDSQKNNTQILEKSNVFEIITDTTMSIDDKEGETLDKMEQVLHEEDNLFATPTSKDCSKSQVDQVVKNYVQNYGVSGNNTVQSSKLQEEEFKHRTKSLTTEFANDFKLCSMETSSNFKERRADQDHRKMSVASSRDCCKCQQRESNFVGNFGTFDGKDSYSEDQNYFMGGEIVNSEQTQNIGLNDSNNEDLDRLKNFCDIFGDHDDKADKAVLKFVCIQIGEKYIFIKKLNGQLLVRYKRQWIHMETLIKELTTCDLSAN